VNNPVLVEVTRGGAVESRHRGSAVVVDADGRIVLAIGDVDAPTFPRSAVKAIQALPLVESGAADGLQDAALALACASHGGEPMHTALAAQTLAKLGLDESALGCGAHWPLYAPATRDLAASGQKPSQLHNNCSGKHAGFLCLACSQGWPVQNYVAAEHPVQQAVRAALEDLTGERLGSENRGIDGCAIPAYAIPLRRLALAFARFATGAGLAPERARAARRLRAACAAYPYLVAGTGRFCTETMRLLGSSLFVKTGAEGVFCAALPEQGLGMAVKVDDGATRAAEVVTAALIARFLPMAGRTEAAFLRFRRPEIRNWNGTLVGELRAAGDSLA
jgi:L-asparaginase II